MVGLHQERCVDICEFEDQRILEELGFIFPTDFFALYHFFENDGGIQVLAGYFDGYNNFNHGGVAINLSQISLAQGLTQFPPINRMLEVPKCLGMDFGYNRGGLRQLHYDGRTQIKDGVTRGDHAMAVGYAAAAMAERLSRTDENNFRVLLPNYLQNVDLQQIIGCTLTAGACHDFHPAGGDAIKIATGLGEREVTDYLGKDATTQQLFAHICQTNGLGYPDKLWQLISDIVNRRDTSIIGQLIHHSNKRRADADFIIYTIADTATLPVENSSSQGSRKDVDGFLIDLSYLLSGNGESRRKPVFNRPNFNPLRETQIINRQLAYTDPEKVANLLRLSAVLYDLRYYSPEIIGPELVLAQGFRDDRNLYPSDEELMTMTTQSLIRAIDTTPAGEFIRSHPRWERIGPLTQSEANGFPSSDENAYPVCLPVNLRLETPVLYQNDVIPITKYMDVTDPANAILLSDLEETYRTKWWLFRPIM